MYKSAQRLEINKIGFCISHFAYTQYNIRYNISSFVKVLCEAVSHYCIYIRSRTSDWKLQWRKITWLYAIKTVEKNSSGTSGVYMIFVETWRDKDEMN